MPFRLYAGSNLCYNLPMKLIIASNNAHKMREILEILGAEFPDMVTLKQAGLDIDVVEDGDTFQVNAIKKAEEVLKASGYPAALADDSGLIVDALGGAPGVYSARYAGEGHNDADNNAKLMRDMAGVPVEQRTCRFASAVALAREGKETICVIGFAEGILLTEARGENGFGYDPYFFYLPIGKSFAELSAEEKNAVSHRKHALEALLELLRREKA
ncbi:MAG: RdgB/HAM1 family non-canonical purine NTP pyrophosphatase [Eubacteriales bacterium]|nr:RdgB/HAM1 family non-canonical purine NTP pyrophosphatase [Eubacteriales bacterium]